MERLLILSLAACCVGIANAESRFHAGLELGLVDGGPLPSFDDGSQGKLRYGRDDDGLQLISGFLQLQSDVNGIWQAKVALDVNSQADDPVGLSEAFLEFRPLPSSGVRWRTRLGAFRPPVSFEHGANGWETLYTTNASAINSWVGEELGGLGVEVVAKRDLAANGARWYWSGAGALFYGNDPSGTVLSWRGWSLNNWQTAWGGEIPLADLPVFHTATGQAPASEPFLELDGDPGYYVWGEIGRAGSARLRALYYDNRADVEAAGHGQSGWRTTFTSLGIQLALPMDTGLIAQWMDGRTYTGPELPGGYALDNDFDAAFMLLTRRVGRHRLSVRRDWFRVDDTDSSPTDPNDEKGRGWTLSYQYSLNDTWRFGLEWLEVDSSRPARMFEQEDVDATERGWFLVLRWRLPAVTVRAG